MTIEELKEKDKNFNSSSFLSKANNMIKKTYNAITLNQLDTVKHFLSNEVFTSFQKEKEEADKKNWQLIYDEVNVNCNIENIKETESDYIIEVSSVIKYLKYYLSKEGKVVKGDANNRQTTTKKITFKKKKNQKENEYHRCLGCGLTIDINNNGKCPQCGRIYDLEEFDYIIENIK